jgi:hypothetical protein
LASETGEAMIAGLISWQLRKRRSGNRESYQYKNDYCEFQNAGRQIFHVSPPCSFTLDQTVGNRCTRQKAPDCGQRRVSMVKDRWESLHACTTSAQVLVFDESGPR